MTLNPLALNAWAALLINAINLIPVGELDGGRIANSVWGRQASGVPRLFNLHLFAIGLLTCALFQAASALSTASLVLLGFSGLISDIALFWVVLIVFLQRGPITPQANELSPPSQLQTGLSIGMLVVGLLVYSPLLVPFS